MAEIYKWRPIDFFYSLVSNIYQINMSLKYMNNNLIRTTATVTGGMKIAKIIKTMRSNWERVWVVMVIWFFLLFVKIVVGGITLNLWPKGFEFTSLWCPFFRLIRYEAQLGIQFCNSGYWEKLFLDKSCLFSVNERFNWACTQVWNLKMVW